MRFTTVTAVAAAAVLTACNALNSLPSEQRDCLPAARSAKLFEHTPERYAHTAHGNRSAVRTLATARTVGPRLRRCGSRFCALSSLAAYRH